jgi:hypothetical protein
MLVLAFVLIAGIARAGVEITPAVQSSLDQWKSNVATWAADPAIVGAVAEQNAKGPLSGVDNDSWKALRRTDPVVKGFQSCPAGQFLAAKKSGSKGAVAEAFLSAAQGEKVAFIDKTSKYVHKGSPKFDTPFNTGKAWQGEPEFDESSQSYLIQISVPVQKDSKSIGVLVVGIDLKALGLEAK